MKDGLGHITETHKKAVAFLKRPRVGFERKMPGDKMPDGTVYAGISPDTGDHMYTMPEDAPEGMMSFDKGMEYAQKLDAHGHQDWRLPTKGELSVLFNNRMAIGGFKMQNTDMPTWYWSSHQDARWRNQAFDQCFNDGFSDWHDRNSRVSVRCVRG